MGKPNDMPHAPIVTIDGSAQQPMAPDLARAIVLIGVMLYASAGLGLYLAQREIIFPGQHTKLRDSPVARVPEATAYRVATSSGASDARFLPPLGAAVARAPVLEFGHSNGEVIDQWLDGNGIP